MQEREKCWRNKKKYKYYASTVLTSLHKDFILPKGSIEYLYRREKSVDTPGSLLRDCCASFCVGKIKN